MKKEKNNGRELARGSLVKNKADGITSFNSEKSN